jgi:transposase
MNANGESNPRRERGLIIAATKKIERKDKDTWIVPSQTTRARYIVRPDGERPYCSCPDHQELNVRCKHLFAVSYVQQRELFPDGTEQVTQTVTVTEKVRKSYPQQWDKYNAAQCCEKEKFLHLLHDLCNGIEEPPQVKGRKRVPLRDAVFCAVYKIYGGFSSRRFSTDVREACDKGFISKAIHFNSVLKALENPDLFPVLKSLIVKSSLPLKTVETTFAIDSSGFTGSRFLRWHDEKWGNARTGASWVKAHVCAGTKTHVITAVEILDESAADSPQLKPLSVQTAKSFKIDQVVGDKAYCSKNNFEIVQDLGGTGFFAFKSGTTGEVGGLFAKMFHYFSFKQEEFLAKYHTRSNIESVFSMVKRKFGDSVRSKTEVAAKNEVLAKLLAHNLTVLIMEMHVLGIEPENWGDDNTSPATLSMTRPA